MALMLRLPRLALVAALTAGALAGPALAARDATRAQQRALTRAVHATPVGGLDEVPRSRYRVTGGQISTVSRSWASAKLVAAPRFRTTFQGGSVLAVQPAGTRGWVVLDEGSAEVGCGIAPDTVLADLAGLQTAPCPPGDGIALSGGGSRRAGAAAQRAIAAAVRESPVAGLDDVPAADYRVTRGRISTLSREWGLAQLVPTRRARDTFQSGMVVLVSPAGTRDWLVVDAGSAQVGCAVAPAAVIASLVGARPGEDPCAGEGIPGS